MTTADIPSHALHAAPPARHAEEARHEICSALPPAPLPPPAPRKRRTLVWRMLTWVIVLAVLGIGGYYAWHYHVTSVKPAAGAARGAGRPTPVVAARAVRGDLPLYLTALGNVSAYNTVTLRTRVDGQLQQLHFTEGQLVHQGDVLFEIDPRPYQVQLTQAQGQVAKDEATLNNAHQDLSRFEAAAEAISKQQIDAAKAAVISAEGTLKADQGAIDAANLNLTYTRIIAPITGKIGLRLVDVGNMVHASDAGGLAVITQLQPIAVTFSIPEDQLPQLQRAMAAQHVLAVETWDRDDSTRLAAGTLEALDNQIDSTTATVRLKAAFSNDDNALYPNQFVNTHLLIDTPKGVVLVPDVAIQRSPTETFIYVAVDTLPAKKEPAGDAESAGSAGGRRLKPAATQTDGPPPLYVEMRPVKVGPTENHLAVIEEGIQPGEIVVTDGVDKLQPGGPITVHFADERGAARGNRAATQPAAGSPARGGRGRGNRPASQPSSAEATRP